MKTVIRDRVQAGAARRTTFFTRQYAILFVGACLLTFALSSYGKSKVSQCNQLVEVVNQASEAQPELVGATIADDNRTLLQAAIKLDGYADQLEMMAFSNQQMQAFQTRFVRLYRDTSKASGAVVSASPNNFQMVRQANRTFIEAQERESPLVQAVNQYCRSE